MCCSDAENTELYINDDIPSTTVETLLQCVYHGKTKIQPVTDEVERFDKLCLEFGIKVKHLEDAEWTLELPFNADDLQKILLSGELSDVTFVVEEEKLSVHRAILCCHSDVLLAMLSGAFAEGHQKEVGYILMFTYTTPTSAGGDTKLSFGVILLPARVAVYRSVQLQPQSGAECVKRSSTF